MEEYLQILKNHPLFKGISMEMKQVLTDLDYKIKRYKKDEYMILTGDTITSMGILMEGEARIIREEIMGNSVIIATLHQGEIFAETFVCAQVVRSPVSVLAEINSTVIWLPLGVIMNDTVDKHGLKQNIMANLLKLFAAKNLYLNKKIDILSKKSIREKFMTYLNFLAKENHSTTVQLELNRNELAQYLSVDRSALSRELMKLKNEGIISLDKNNISIIRDTE